MTAPDLPAQSSATRMPAIRVPAGLTFAALVGGIVLSWLLSEPRCCSTA
jgi:hypothetical protein